MSGLIHRTATELAGLIAAGEVSAADGASKFPGRTSINR